MKKSPFISRLILFFGVFLMLVASSYGQNHIRVKSGSSGGNGSSWTLAFAELQDAIDFASSGDTIMVAAGTYLPTQDKNGNDYMMINDQRERTFTMKDGVHIYGGFEGVPSEAVTSDRLRDVNTDTLIYKTILSGDCYSSWRTLVS